MVWLRELTSLPDLSTLIDCCGRAMVLALNENVCRIVGSLLALSELELRFLEVGLLLFLPL